MLNSDNVDINYQLSNNKCDIQYFDRASFDGNSFSWRKTDLQTTTMSSSNSLKEIISSCNSKENQSFTNVDTNDPEFHKLIAADVSSVVMANSVIHLPAESHRALRPAKYSRPRITIKNIKALMSNDVLNNLPFDVHQHLVSLMPECDKIISTQNIDDTCLSLSNTALNNEFFNKALIRFMCKLTNGKTILSSESFVNRIRNASAKKLSKITSCCNASANCPRIQNSQTITQSAAATIRLDSDINDAKINCDFEVESPIFVSNRDYENKGGLKESNDVITQSRIVDNSFEYNTECFGESYNTIDNSELDIFHNELADLLSNHYSQYMLSHNSDTVIVHKSAKYKRCNSSSSPSTTPNIRPTRSTAGQLPARLKSSSPQPCTQGTLISDFLYRSHSPKINKSFCGRKKNREKRKYKSNEHNISQHDGNCETKPTSFHNDTILLNLRTKLSKRIRENSLKDHSSDHFSRPESTVDFQSDMNVFNSKSPISLSPESDKLPFVDSPLSKNDQNHFRHSKFRNQYFDNQTPSSPQWSFSSEFTSQSSVESVLSQKNMRIDLEDVSIAENILDDMDSEEMPPPRRTLTVAAMREKMRAKKMAKEEKRKDFDKDFSFDVDRIEDTRCLDMLEKHCQSSDMSNMMAMCQDNDDDNIASEFDSFLIDDYHEEIDDKILNYSDDLDDLLLSGGNESLLEIIMKDPDAMEIGNDSFSALNSDGQHRNTVVSMDQSKSLFSDSPSQSHNSVFTNTSKHNLTDSSSTNHKPPLSVSSVCRIDNSILSQALTSVIQKSDSTKFCSKDTSQTKSALQNAYLVDGNGLSDALKLIQSLNPSAKVTTQQFYLVNSGPQLVLSQAPPTQACSTRTISVQTPIKSTPVTNHQTAAVSTAPKTCDSNSRVNSCASAIVTAPIFTNTKSTTMYNQQPALSSTVSVLPQLSAFNTKPSNIFSLNSNFANTNIGCKFPGNNIQYQQTSLSSVESNCSQQSSIFTTQNPITLTQNPQNTFGIRLQLAQNFQNGQHLNILQPTTGQMIPTLMNQSLQFISPQHNVTNNNISLITQTQPMSKLVFLYPNLNCSTQLSNDLTNSLKTDPQQQLIFLSQPSQDQPTFQVLNGSNIWQQISPNLGNLLGSPSTANNLVLMNPQALNTQPFSFNYHQSSPLITATGNNLVMMSSAQGPKINQSNKMITTPISSLSINVSKPDLEDSNNHTLSSNNNFKSHTNVNSNSSQNSCIEQLSNSSSSATSKLSFDEKMSKLETLTDSDQEKSINSPQFQLLNNYQMNNGNDSSSGIGNRCMHLTVDIDSPSNHSLYQNSTNNNNDNNRINDDTDTDYDQSDFEIPCLYSTNKIDISVNKTNNTEHNDFDI